MGERSGERVRLDLGTIDDYTFLYASGVLFIYSKCTGFVKFQEVI